MDIKKLIRDAKRVREAIHVSDDKKISISKGDIKIVFPKNYTNGKLGFLDTKFNVVGIHAIVLDEKYYCVSICNAVMPLSPTDVNIMKIGKAEYYVLSFAPGAVICPNLLLLRNNQLVYEISNEIISLGKTPWYLDTELMARLFDSAKEYATVDLGATPSILELKVSSRARDPNNLLHYRKEDYKTQSDFENLPVSFVPQKSVAFTATNTSARLLGPYLKEGVLVSMVNKSESNEIMEDVLRV